MPRKKASTPAVYYVGKRPHLHVPCKVSPEIKDLAKAMLAGNVEAVVAIIYTTDGDVYRIHDIGRLKPFDVAADVQEMASRFS